MWVGLAVIVASALALMTAVATALLRRSKTLAELVRQVEARWVKGGRSGQS